MINLDINKNRVIVTFPYSDQLVAAMKRIDGGRFRKELPIGPHWKFPLTKLSELLREFPDAWKHPRVATWLAGAERARMLKALPDAPQPLGIVLPLRRFQKIAVNFLGDMPRSICSAGVGTGKTFMGIGWAANHSQDGDQRRGILVVTKSVGKYKYASEILRAVPKARVAVIEGEKGIFPSQEHADWVLLNYDLLWPRIEQIKAFGFSAIIFSEAHKLKSITSLRTKTALDLSSSVPAILLETASLTKNRNGELFAPLCILGYLDKEEDYWSYHMRFCLSPDPKKHKKYIGRRKQVWDFSHSSRSEELHAFISPFTYSITKEEALPDLPEVYFTPTMVDLSNASEYEHAELNFAEEYLDKVAKEQEEEGKSEKEIQAKVRKAKKAVALVRLGKLLQLAAIGNSEAAEDLLESYVEAHEKVVVFCSNLDPLDYLYSKFQECSVRIVGGMGAKKQFEAQEEFQNRPEILIALCSTEAAGESITLTAASSCIFLSLPWSPETFAQAYGRLHRDGQKNAVEVTVLVGRYTVQIDQIEVLYGKAIDISKVVTGKDRSPNSEALRKILAEVKDVPVDESLLGDSRTVEA